MCDPTALFIRHLRALDGCVDKAQANARERNVSPDLFVQARLAADQYSFARQIQAACDSAKFGAAKPAGREPPSHPDTEATLAELKARIHAVVAYLETFTPDDFDPSQERRCSHTWMKGKWMRTGDYLEQFAIPNFLFHVTTAYAILRHNGVPLGKSDFIGALSLQG